MLAACVVVPAASLVAGRDDVAAAPVVGSVLVAVPVGTSPVAVGPGPGATIVGSVVLVAGTPELDTTGSWLTSCTLAVWSRTGADMMR